MGRKGLPGKGKAVMIVTSLGVVIMIITSLFCLDAVGSGPLSFFAHKRLCSRETYYSSNVLIQNKGKDLTFPIEMNLSRTAQDHFDRIRLLSRVCNAGPESKFLGSNQTQEETNFIFDEEHRLLYCPIEKVGSSFWKRVFVLLKEKQQEVSVFNLSGVSVHRTLGAYSDTKSKPFILKYFYLKSYTKFLFVRDPYERLFSGYIDKIFSPSYETKAHSATIGRSFRETRQQNSSCVTDVNFSEFCQYVTNHRGVHVNTHYTPMYSKCFPCHLDYHFVGKMEMFQDDAIFILASAGVNPTSVLGDQPSFQSANDLSIMRDVAMRAFDVIGRDKGKCLQKAKMLRRAWTSYQIRGYLSIRNQFPVTDSQAEGLTAEQFVDLAKQTYGNSGSREECKSQRKAAMLEAFYSIPRTLLKKVESFVEKDCKLFGYICDVDQRFPETQRPKSMFHLDNFL